MTEEEFESLRRWGEALGADPRPEVRAAGKAILMLAEEVERLQVELWHRRIGVDAPSLEPEPEAPEAREAREASDAPVPVEETPAEPEPELATDLRSVVARFRRRLQPARVFHRD